MIGFSKGLPGLLSFVLTLTSLVLLLLICSCCLSQLFPLRSDVYLLFSHLHSYILPNRCAFPRSMFSSFLLSFFFLFSCLQSPAFGSTLCLLYRRFITLDNSGKKKKTFWQEKTGSLRFLKTDRPLFSEVKIQFTLVVINDVYLLLSYPSAFLPCLII